MSASLCDREMVRKEWYLCPHASQLINIKSKFPREHNYHQSAFHEPCLIPEQMTSAQNLPVCTLRLRQALNAIPQEQVSHYSKSASL